MTTHGPADDARTRYQAAKRESRALLAEMQLEKVQRAKKRLNESQVWDYLGPYGDILDRLKGAGQGQDFYGVHSHAGDRRFGANWPFWRTWIEHARLRASARLLVTMNPMAFGAVEALTSFVVGEGFTYRAIGRGQEDPPTALLLAVQDVVDEFSDANKWPQLEQELFQRSRRDGEYLLRDFVDDDGLTTVRTVEPEQLLEAPGEPLETGSFGVFNKPDDLQSVTGYWVSYNGDPQAGEHVPPDELVFCKVNVDRIIKRGLTDFCFDTHSLMRTAGRLLENLGEGGAVQSALAMIRQHATASASQVQAFASGLGDFQQTADAQSGRTEAVRRVRPGEVEDIPEGMQYVVPPWTQNVPGFVSIVQAVLRGVAVRWNAPEWLVSADASNNNYASALVAESPFVRTVLRRQKYYKGDFKATVWRAVRHRCEARGGLYAAGTRYTWEEVRRLVDLEVKAPTAEIRDKQAEAATNATYVQMGAKSPQMVAAEIGTDYEQAVEDLEAHQERLGAQAPALPGMDDGQGGGGLASLLGEGLQRKPCRGCRELTEGVDGDDELDRAVAIAWRGGLIEAFVSKPDKNGVMRCYQDGKRVSCPKSGDAGGDGGKKKAANAPDKEALKKKLQGKLSPEELKAVTKELMGLTVAEINAIKKDLGLKASGAKAELTKKIVERAQEKLLAKAAGKKPAPPKKPAGKPKADPKPAPKADPKPADATPGGPLPFKTPAQPLAVPPGTKAKDKVAVEAVVKDYLAAVGTKATDIQKAPNAFTWHQKMATHLSSSIPGITHWETEYALKNLMTQEAAQLIAPQFGKGGASNKANKDLPDGTRPKLSLQEQHAVQAATLVEQVAAQWYTGSGFAGINRGLRDGKDLPADLAERHKHLQAAFGKAKVLDKPVALNRGMALPPEHLKALVAAAQEAQQGGHQLRFDGYISTATKAVSSFQGNVKLKINAVHGLDLLPYTHYPHETEMLLNHGSHFTVKGVKQVGGKWEIELDQVPPSASASPAKNQVTPGTWTSGGPVKVAPKQTFDTSTPKGKVQQALADHGIDPDQVDSSPPHEVAAVMAQAGLYYSHQQVTDILKGTDQSAKVKPADAPEPKTHVKDAVHAALKAGGIDPNKLHHKSNVEIEAALKKGGLTMSAVDAINVLKDPGPKPAPKKPWWQIW